MIDPEAIEALGGSLESGARWDASTATVGVMSARISPAMGILAEIVRHPVFKDEEIERLRQQYLDSLAVELGQPGTIASFAAARLVFGDSPYGHPLGGTPESIARIKRDDIVALHNTYYRPDNAILVIGGDITADAAFALALQHRPRHHATGIDSCVRHPQESLCAGKSGLGQVARRQGQADRASG